MVGIDSEATLSAITETSGYFDMVDPGDILDQGKELFATTADYTRYALKKQLFIMYMAIIVQNQREYQCFIHMVRRKLISRDLRLLQHLIFMQVR